MLLELLLQPHQSASTTATPFTMTVRPRQQLLASEPQIARRRPGPAAAYMSATPARSGWAAMHTDWPARQYQDALPLMEWLVGTACGRGGALIVTRAATAGWRAGGRPVGTAAGRDSAIAPSLVVSRVLSAAAGADSDASAVTLPGHTGANAATTGWFVEPGAAAVDG